MAYLEKRNLRKQQTQDERHKPLLVFGQPPAQSQAMADGAIDPEKMKRLDTQVDVEKLILEGGDKLTKSRRSARVAENKRKVEEAEDRNLTVPASV